MDLRMIIGLAGSVILVTGVATANQQRKNALFAIGSSGMFAYALLGYLGGGPVFFLILQIFIAISTLCMLFKVSDAYDTPILAAGGLALVAWSLSMFEGASTAIFVVGLGLLGVGFAMDPGTPKRERALFLGSAIIAVFSYLMRDWIFVGLNAVFAALSLKNLLHMRRGGRARMRRV